MFIELYSLENVVQIYDHSILMSLTLSARVPTLDVDVKFSRLKSFSQTVKVKIFIMAVES